MPAHKLGWLDDDKAASIFHLLRVTRGFGVQDKNSWDPCNLRGCASPQWQRNRLGKHDLTISVGGIMPRSAPSSVMNRQSAEGGTSVVPCPVCRQPAAVSGSDKAEVIGHERCGLYSQYGHAGSIGEGEHGVVPHSRGPAHDRGEAVDAQCCRELEHIRHAKPRHKIRHRV